MDWQFFWHKEKNKLIWIGIILLIGAFYSFILGPMLDEYITLKDKVSIQNKQLSHMVRLAQSIQGVNRRSISNNALFGEITKLSNQHGIRAAFSAIEVKDNTVFIKISEVNYQTLIRFLLAAHTLGIIVSNVSLDAVDIGLVSGSLSLVNERS